MITIMLGFNLLGVLLFLSQLHAQKIKIKALEGKCAELRKSMDQVLKDYSLLVSADLKCSKQLREIVIQLVSMDNQLQGLENKRDNDGGYQHALRILEMGGEKEEIISSCHLSNAEADLLINLHAYGKAIKVSS